MVNTDTAATGDITRSPGSGPGQLSAQRRLAGQVSGLRFADLPVDVVDTAIDCILDTVAVAIAGAGEEVVRHVVTAAEEAGPCSGLDGKRYGARAAALVNGTAAHALDFDDWLAAGGLHPSAPLLPAALAQAELAGPERATPVDGTRVLAAYVAGFEAQARIGAAVAPGHYGAGFHPTGTIGVFGAAAGAAHLLGADGEQVATALSLAATTAAGLRSMFGTMAKPLHAGRAAEGGLLAARLATAGFTASTDAIVGPSGFAECHGLTPDIEPLQVPFAERWYLRDVQLKQHASCFGTHAAIEALRQLRADVDPDDIVEIELTVSELLRTVCSIPAPTTPLEGKFSLAFTSALALLAGRCATTDFTPERVHDPRLRDLAARVRLHYDPSLPAQTTYVRLRLADGRERTAEADSAAIPAPATRRSTAREKFRSLVSPVLGTSRTEGMAAAIDALADGGDLAAVTRLVSPTACGWTPISRSDSHPSPSGEEEYDG